MNLELLLSQGQPDSGLLTSAESPPLFDLPSLLVFDEFNGDSYPSNSLQFKHSAVKVNSTGWCPSITCEPPKN